MDYQPRYTPKHSLVQAVVFLLSCQKAISSSAAAKLDLSYLHRTKASAIADAIRETLKENQNVDIDISSSLIGKDVKDLLLSLEGRESATIQLAARRNYWSSDEAASLFQAIVGPDKSNEKGKDAKKEESGLTASKPDEETNQDYDAQKSDTQKEEEDSSGFASIVSLDLGWNDIGHDSRKSKSFLKALQKTVEDPKKCPTVLRFDVCGLGPNACRALGKVRRIWFTRLFA
jgi:hypothetical protein